MISSSDSSAKTSSFKNSTILLVEDNVDHLSRIKAALQECIPGINAVGVGNRKAALDFLDLEWQKKGKNVPKLILLDLYLPTRDEGLAVLDEFKSYFKDRSEPCIPVVVFSNSDRPEDIHACYAKGANAYLVQSLNTQEWNGCLDGIRNFWLETVSLPVHPV
jgi:CheY-like chemotaxis protein